MRILFTPSDNNQFSGAFLCMVRLATKLRDKYGHDVFVVLPFKGDGEELLNKNNIKNVCIPSYSWVVPLDEKNNIIIRLKQFIKSVINIRSVYQIKKIIRSEKIDLIDVNTSWCYVGAVAAKQSNTPYIWHIREFLEEGQSLTIWRREHGYQLMREADQVITVSTSLYNKYASVLNPDRMTVVLDGIEPKRFLDRSHVILRNSEFRFLIVGGVIPTKKQEELIKACIELHDEGFTQFHLDLAGNDYSQYAVSLKALVVEKKAYEYISFLGNVANPENLYRKADITFMCSEYEGFGRVTVEAMLSGSLVIGAHSTGTLDILRESETGYFYTSGDVHDLKEKIKYAVQHPDKSRKIAKQGQIAALERFTADVNAENTNRVFERAFQEHQNANKS